MGDLFNALKRGEKITEEMLNRALMRANVVCAHITQSKTESEQDKIPKELREHWARENSKLALKGHKIHSSDSEIPQSLRETWQKEDIKRKLES